VFCELVQNKGLAYLVSCEYDNGTHQPTENEINRKSRFASRDLKNN